MDFTLNYKKVICLLAILMSGSGFATNTVYSSSNSQKLYLQEQPGFFRFSYDDVKMPQGIQNMGLLGLNYSMNITPQFYAGIGGFGSIAGTQGGLFVLGANAGFRHELIPRWWGDVGIFAGGGGGRASLVGGGLMVRPSIGIEYSWDWARLGLHYSYIDFPSGKISSSQVGLDLDIPWDFYYVQATPLPNSSVFNFNSIFLSNGKFLDFQRNDFALLLQAYNQQKGTKNVLGNVQDDTIGLIGAELDHYFREHVFWYFKAAGAFSGNPNGYMDVLGGFGYHLPLKSLPIAFVPQLGLGAGGGGNTQTGGGVLIQPQIGLELPLSTNFATRLSGGYIWSPKGNLRAATVTGEIIYHLNVATASDTPNENLFSSYFSVKNWRLQLFNQTYLHPERASIPTRSAIQLIAFQIDQLFSPHFFMGYQAASAYSGTHAGGYATGMIGPGLQTSELCHHHLQFFTELFIGAGGGGNLALGGGALIEPIVGLHYAFTPAIGLQTSLGQLKALHNNLNTPVFNLGFTLKFGMLGLV